MQMDSSVPDKAELLSIGSARGCVSFQIDTVWI